VEIIITPSFLVFRTLFKHIRTAEVDDLKEFDAEKFQGNPYQGLFKYLAELSTTNTSEESIIRAHQRNTSVSSITTELSTSSNEDSNETVSTAALRDFTNYTLMNMGIYKNLAVSVGQGRKIPHLSWLETSGPKDVLLSDLCDSLANLARFKFTIGGTTHEAVNDGQVAVNFPGSASGSDRKSYLSVISLEVRCIVLLRSYTWRSNICFGMTVQTSERWGLEAPFWRA
jgi:hypothetical protein